MLVIKVEGSPAEVFNVDFEQSLQALRFLRDLIPPKPRARRTTSGRGKTKSKSVRKSGR